MTSLSLYLAAVLLGTNFSAVSVPTTRIPLTVASSMSTRSSIAEQQLIDMVNSERWERKLNVLRPNPTLAEVARAHSREMAMLNYFDHYSPNIDYRSPMKRYLKTLGYTPKYACVSENLYYCSRFNIRRGHTALMNSPSHRANILSDRFNEVGVGVYVAPDGSLWVTEMFLKQEDQPAQFSQVALQKSEPKS